MRTARSLAPHLLTPRPVEHWPPLTPSADVAAALGERLGLPAGACRPVRPARAQARSTVHFLGTADRPDRCRWVVKQPRTGWTQDDVASPLAAEQEYAALVRLAAHFDARGAAVGVPAPVALLPGLGGLATAYVPGPALSDLLHAGRVLSPAMPLDGVGRAADFLRVLHEVDPAPSAPLDLASEAERVRCLLSDRLVAAGLPVPPGVLRALAAVPDVRVPVRRVRLHGDWTPANVLLPAPGSVVGIDVDLREVGPPEEDLARFVAFTAGSAPFLLDATLPEHLRRHRPLVACFLGRYEAGGSRVSAPVFELRLLHQLAGRWLRLRELARLHGRPALLPLRLHAVDAQLRSLLAAGAHRLTRATRDPGG
ncbi:aminoglycoside phosphotransferase family protein [Geodermatophilus sp. URMC 62]|uniref:aminoglycoside phosphotransferase family protein n=1 Tax=Geodermatophilus sp. URMC 62 TaxID=3423414 RepID=UPI00406C5515